MMEIQLPPDAEHLDPYLPESNALDNRSNEATKNPLGSNEEDKIKTETEEESSQTFTYLEVKSATESIIQSENLLHFNVKNWILYLRNDFDCVVEGEPYQALSFLLNLETGQFYIRVWNRSIRRGTLKSTIEVSDKLSEAFQSQRPCLGLDHVGKTALKSKAVATELPFTRYVSINCEYFAKSQANENDKEDGNTLCTPCSKLKPKPKVKIEESPVLKEVAAVTNFDEPDSDPDYKAEVDETSDPDYDEAEDFDDHDDFDIDIEAFKEQCLSEGTWKSDSKTKLKRGRKRKKREWRETLECQDCLESFYSPQSLHEHITVSHPETISIECKVCGEDVKVFDLVAHFASCINDKKTKSSNLKCDCCDKTFKTPKSHREHRAVKHLAGNFRCPVCDHRFGFAAEFSEHLKLKHAEDLTEAECKVCKKSVDSNSYLSHYQGCKEEQVSERRKVARLKATTNGIKCRYCDIVFQSYVQRDGHEQKEHIGLQFQCDHCDFKTHSKMSYKSHLKKKHGDKNLSKVCCPVCGKKVDKEYLDKHIRYIHDGKYDNIPCHICGMVFKYAYALNDHKNKMHSDDPRFKCDFCDLRFKNTSNKAVHELTHKEATWCCNYCGKTLKTQKSLTIHERIHTGEKPFKCKQCDYACKSNVVLFNHVKYVHRGVPYRKKSTDPKNIPLNTSSNST